MTGRPLPVPDESSAQFWSAAGGHVLTVARCARCEQFTMPPDVVCPHCHTTDPRFEFTPVSGRGTVRSWTVVRQALLPGFDDDQLNGTYTAASNSQWAKTNDICRDEASVRSTWTITTTCTTPVECTERVTSDVGWSADVSIHGSEYVVKHDIPNWEPCPNGAARTGHQIYRFYPVDERGWVSYGSTVFAGMDTTSGDSGACGTNKALVITMPFRLEKLG